MKKRTIAVVLAAAMAMSSLAGCSGSEKPADTTAAATETTTVAATEMKEESTKAPESKETEVKTEEVVSSNLTWTVRGMNAEPSLELIVSIPIILMSAALQA